MAKVVYEYRPVDDGKFGLFVVGYPDQLGTATFGPDSDTPKAWEPYTYNTEDEARSEVSRKNADREEFERRHGS